MAMGSTSRVVLNDEMQKAKAVCAAYRSTVSSLMSTLDGAVETLLNSGFQGEAADGFNDFYKNNIQSFFASGNTFDKFLSMFDKDGEGLFDSIEKALIIGEGLDPSLGQNNKSIGQSDGQPDGQTV